MRGDRAILTLLGMTFVGLFIDVRYMHRFVLSMHWESKIPLYACGLALVAVVFAIFDHAKAKGIAAWLFAVVAVVGLVGVYEHTHFATMMFMRYMTGEDLGGPQPTWAPMAFTLLGSIGYVLCSPKFRWRPC